MFLLFLLIWCKSEIDRIDDCYLNQIRWSRCILVVSNNPLISYSHFLTGIDMRILSIVKNHSDRIVDNNSQIDIESSNHNN